MPVLDPHLAHMAVEKLTKRAVDAAPIGTKDTYLWDTELLATRPEATLRATRGLSPMASTLRL